MSLLFVLSKENNRNFYGQYGVGWALTGLLSGLTETFGGFLILLGLAFRPVCILLTFNLLVAALMHLNSSEDYMSASQAIETGFMFLGLIFTGPGRYSVDKK